MSKKRKKRKKRQAAVATSTSPTPFSPPTAPEASPAAVAIESPQIPAPVPGAQSALLVRRTLAFLYDLLFLALANAIILSGVMLILLYRFAQPIESGTSIDLSQMRFCIFSAVLLAAILSWLYFPVLESSRQQASIGKLLLNIRVFRADGTRCTFLQAHLRLCAAFLSLITLGIGFILAIFHPKHLTIHDRLSDTCVLIDKNASSAA